MITDQKRKDKAMGFLKLVVKTFENRILHNPQAAGAPARRRYDGGDPGWRWDLKPLNQPKPVR